MTRSEIHMYMPKVSIRKPNIIRHETKTKKQVYRYIKQTQIRKFMDRENNVISCTAPHLEVVLNRINDGLFYQYNAMFV